MIDPYTILSRRSDLVISDIDDELVIFDAEQRNYFGLDATGSIIWEKLAQPITVSALLEQLLEQFEVERSVCMRETIAFLRQLHQDKLIVIQ